jgi:predicted peptidase
MKLLLLLALLPLLGCAAAVRADNGPGPGRHPMVIELENGEKVRFALSLPELKAGERAPLILALHFGGPATPGIGMTFLELLAGPAFEPMGAIIVAPDCPGQGWSDPTSEQAALALVRHTIEQWPVDPARVAVSGFSMGGMGTWHLAARHPDLFSAALPVAGIPGDGPPVEIPLYAIHSRNDEVIALGPAKRAVKEMKKQGLEAKLVVLEDGPTHYDTTAFAPALRHGAKWLEKLWRQAEADD